jgi:hypothetical protein
MFEIYAYGNVDTLTGVFNAIAAIMGGAGYLALIKTMAVTGVLVAAAAGSLTPAHGLAAAAAAARHQLQLVPQQLQTAP